MGSLRTPEEEKRYELAKQSGILDGACKLCQKESIDDFTYWRIVTNDFPYDRIATRHDMLIPRRHVTEPEFTPQEIVELEQIKRGHIDETYQWIMEPVHQHKSLPGHFHLHLIVTKAW